MTRIICFAVLINLILSSAFFSASETAYLSLSKIQVRNLLRQKARHAKKIMRLHEKVSNLLAIILICNNFINTLFASLSTALAVAIAGKMGVAIATVASTLIIIIFGEVLPKSIALCKPLETSTLFSVPLSVLQKIFFPFTFLFSLISKIFCKNRGRSRAHNQSAHDNTSKQKVVDDKKTFSTIEELQTLFSEGEKEGVLQMSETKMLNKVFRFNDLSVHDIMKHRSRVTGVSVCDSYEKVSSAFIKSGFSHLVVFENTNQHQDGDFNGENKTETSQNVTGVINYKSVLFGKIEIRKPLFVPETFSALELLQKFRATKETFAVVLNEQGEFAGVATIDDVTKVIFDKMTDDNFGSLPEERVKIINEKEFFVPGDMSIEDVNEFFGFALASESFNTIGGWLLEQFGCLPRNGDFFIWNKNLFIVEELRQRQIKNIKIKL